MAAPAYRSSNTGGGSTTTSVTVTAPSGVAADDILLYGIYLEGDLSSTITWPSGFTQIRSTSQTGGTSFDYRLAWAWKRAGGSEPGSYQASGWTSNYNEAWVAAYSGCVTSGTPYDAEDGVANANQNDAPTTPSITTADADRLVVCAYTSWDGGPAVWAPGASGLTERIDSVSKSLYDVAQASAGSTGAKTISCTGGLNPEWHVGHILALASPAAVQVAHPSADVADGGWTNEAGSQTDLYASIDEVSPSDADYIQSSVNPAADLCTIRVGALTDPVSSSGHVVRYRYAKDTAGGQQVDLTVRLYRADGTTVVASQTHTNIGATLTDGSFTLTGTEADSIPGADYVTGLVLGFEAETP